LFCALKEPGPGRQFCGFLTHTNGHVGPLVCRTPEYVILIGVGIENLPQLFYHSFSIILGKKDNFGWWTLVREATNRETISIFVRKIDKFVFCTSQNWKIRNIVNTISSMKLQSVQNYIIWNRGPWSRFRDLTGNFTGNTWKMLAAFPTNIPTSSNFVDQIANKGFKMRSTCFLAAYLFRTQHKFGISRFTIQYRTKKY